MPLPRPQPRPLALAHALAVLAAPVLAQDPTSPRPSRPEEAPPPTLSETVITATRVREPAQEVPFAIETVDAQALAERSYRTLPQALRDLPGVMVQETAHGQGSPYIRGFTGLRNVLLVDGIRLNNSVFREGPNQYWNTVDALSLERVEILKGPSSVLYGSDAIGGAVQALTPSALPPVRSPAPGEPAAVAPVYGRLLYRYADAEASNTLRAETGLSLWDGLGGLRLGGTFRDFGDLEGGRDTGEQPNTGYDELDGDVKLERLVGETSRLTLAHQRVRQDDVPRTHRTIYAVPFEGTTVGSDRKRDLDQNRDLTYLQLAGGAPGEAIEGYRLSLSWHAQEESRHRIRGSGARERQGFEVGTLGLLAEATTSSSFGRLTFGLDYYRDEVDSFSTTNPVQGPVADDATYDLLGLYLQDRIELRDDLELTLGARLNYAAADADRVSDPVSGNPIDVDEDWTALVGSARFLHRLGDGAWSLFGGVSQGFRAPNLSDLTRFDSARTNEFEVPAPGLDPEEFLTFELGVKTEREQLAAQASFFYTDIEDQIVRFPTGNTNAAGEFEITKDNVGDGYVFGVELGASYDFLPEWSVFGNATFLDGRVETYPSSAAVVDEEYPDRLMPLTAQLGLRWERADTWAEFMTVVADDADRLSTRDKGDTSRIPPGGTPGYEVLHLRAGRRLGEHAHLRLGIENVFDEDYRVHGSGQNMPGRNLIGALEISF